MGVKNNVLIHQIILEPLVYLNFSLVIRTYQLPAGRKSLKEKKVFICLFFI